VKTSLEQGGRFLMVIGNLWQMVAASWQRPVIGGSPVEFNGDGCRTLVALAEQGVLEPVIDSVLPFDRIVDAHRRVDGGHKVGSLVLTLDQGR